MPWPPAARRHGPALRERRARRAGGPRAQAPPASSTALATARRVAVGLRASTSAARPAALAAAYPGAASARPSPSAAAAVATAACGRGELTGAQGWSASRSASRRFSPMPSTSRSSASDPEAAALGPVLHDPLRERGPDTLDAVELLHRGRAEARLGLRPAGAGGTGCGHHDLLAVVDARGEVEGVHVRVGGRAARPPDGDGHARALGAPEDEAGPADRARHVHEVARRRRGAPRHGRPARDPYRRARLPLAAARQAQQRDPAEHGRDEPDEERSRRAVGHAGDRRRRRVTRGLRVRRAGDIARVRTRTSRKPATLAGKVEVSAERCAAPARG